MTVAASSLSARSLLDDDEYRVDGHAKVTGEAQFAADFSREGMLWAAFVASPHAHASIRAYEIEEALQTPGVHAVLTGNDVPDRFFGRTIADWPVLAQGRVLFIGQYVAAVAAESREIARAAAEKIIVHYETLTPIFDPEEALRDGQIALHGDRSQYAFQGRVGTAPKHAHPNIQGRIVVERGDTEAGFASAAHVFEHCFSTPRHHGGYIEPHATLVWIGPDGVVHVISTCKSPFALKSQLAVCTGVPAETIVVEQSCIGGDFGAKGLSVDDFPCYFLAKATGRPVKFVRSYLDDVRSTNTRHAAQITMKSGVDGEGRLIAFAARVLYDGGAFAAAKPVPHLLPGSFLSKTPYRIPHAHVELLAAYTNTVPAGHVRSPGDMQIVFALESHMDMVATELGIDPIDYRLRNVLVEDESDIDGLPYIEPRGKEILEILRREGAWDEPLPPGRGKGVALTAHHIGHGRAEVRITVAPDGRLVVHTPMMDQGVGALTMLQRTAATVLGISTAWFTFDCETSSSSLAELGPGATRVTALSGRACQDAAEQVRERLVSCGWDGTEATLPRAAAIACGDAPSFAVIGAFELHRVPGRAESNNFSGYMVDLSVDCETGALSIHDIVYVADVGTVINPLAHQGQIDGGFIFGLGHALSEELLLEEGRIVNLTFADYKIPVQRDLPPFRSILLPTHGGPGPFGSKAIGESSSSSIAPAVANAVARACGVRVPVMPITAQRIYDALHHT
ncbi:MAG: xanthine dehydrogenase family protein molybdopterin-binding subunit [Candidatus Lustribacter sp.]|jgi:carbon-monoxide dehydrogenase large subunit